MIHGFVSAQALALLFLFFGLAIAVFIRHLRNTYTWIPYTPSLFLISIILGYTSEYTGIIGESIKQISLIDPHGILLIFLPPLIFQSSFNSDWYIFRKQSVQIFILAFPAVLVSALLVMFFIKVVIGYSEEYYTFSQAFMFGSVLSCTDTVAVLALLKEAGAPRKFNSLIEGESLLNDGTCMILFTISLELVKGSAPPPLKIVQLFLQLTVGAIILGVVFGFISAKLIYNVKDHPILTLNITVASCYLLYFVAEYVDFGIKISGIMALAAMGLYMAAFGKTKIAPEAAEVVQNFWKTYIYIAESVIFILGGAIVGVQGLNADFVSILNFDNILKLGYLYLCMTAARFLSITLFMPKLRSEGYGLKWKQVFALTYGGLRGAIGIAFTLILSSNGSLHQKFRMISLFNTSGCAFLTLMINAPTCSYVIKKLGLCVKSQSKIRFFTKLMENYKEQLNQQIDEMQKNRHLQNANWEKVKQDSGFPEFTYYIEMGNQGIKQRMNLLKEHQKQMTTLNQNLIQPSINQFKQSDTYDLSQLIEIRNKFCVTLKVILWQKFQKNQCSSESIRVLIQCINIDMDTLQQPLNSWEYLVSHLNNPYFFPICYWLKSKPIIGKYAFSWIYQRVKLLYDVISTYLDALEDCQQEWEKQKYDKDLQRRTIQQSSQNRKLAQSFLDQEIKVSYFQIMKRIQTTKAAQSILAYQKQILHRDYQFGQIDDRFYKQIYETIEQCIEKLEKDSQIKQTLSDIDVLRMCEFFNQFSDQQLKRILTLKSDLLVQKDQPVLRSYEKQKYLYLVVRGELSQQYKQNGDTLYQRRVGMYQLAGVGTMLINRRQLQFVATAQSVVTLFCFPIHEIKDLISKKFKLQQILQNDIFMLQIKLEPDIYKELAISDVEWKKRKSLISFKRLAKDQKWIVENVYLVLIFGDMRIGSEKHIQGCFNIQGTATIQGPAKFYFLSLLNLHQEQVRKSNHDLIRPSLSKRERTSTAARNFGGGDVNAIIRKTLHHNKD